jgi:hypothetical protein
MFYLSQSEITAVDSNFGVRTSKNIYLVENIGGFFLPIFMRFLPHPISFFLNI